MTKSFRRLKWRLYVRLLPRHVLCVFRDHSWGESNAAIIDGPIHLPPRERDWIVLGFQKQCDRCYTIRDVDYTQEEADAAVEAEIVSEEFEEAQDR